MFRHATIVSIKLSKCADMCRTGQICADMHKMHITLLAVPGHCPSWEEDTCQSVSFNLSIFRTIRPSSLRLCSAKKSAEKNQSCFARLKCNSCLEGTKFHSLSDTWSARTVKMPPEPHSKAWVPRLNITPKPNIQKSQWDAFWKWIGLNWDFVLLENRRQMWGKYWDAQHVLCQ